LDEGMRAAQEQMNVERARLVPPPPKTSPRGGYERHRGRPKPCGKADGFGKVSKRSFFCRALGGGASIGPNRPPPCTSTAPSLASAWWSRIGIAPFPGSDMMSHLIIHLS